MADESQVVVQEDLDEQFFLDESNPRNVLNLVTRKVRESIKRVAELNPEFIQLSEIELRNLLNPNETTDRIRISFWKEYYRAQDHGTRMRMRNVFSPVMTEQTFYEYVLTDDKRVAWMICPPADHLTALEADLNYAKGTLGRILRMDVLDEDNNIDLAKAKIFLSAYEKAENRVEGAVVQKIEQKNLNVSANLGKDDSELKLELEQLKSKHSSNMAIDVTSTNSTSDNQG